jgi:hypothetical protein
MSSQVFRKTESGKAEIARRQAGLSPAARTVLIMVNGSDSVNALAARGLPQLQGHLETLLARGLIEPVVARAAPVALPSPPPAVTQATVISPAIKALLTVPATASAPERVGSADPNFDALRRKAMAHLCNHFGPDTPLVAQALLAARSVAEFNAALDGIESKLAIYLGRKQAARELQALRPAL